MYGDHPGGGLVLASSVDLCDVVRACRMTVFLIGQALSALLECHALASRPTQDLTELWCVHLNACVLHPCVRVWLFVIFVRVFSARQPAR